MPAPGAPDVNMSRAHRPPPRPPARGDPPMTDAEAQGAAVLVAALTAARRFDELRRQGERLAQGGIEPGLLREAAYAAALFCGFPSGVAALQALAELEPTEVRPHEDAPAERKELRRRGTQLF